MILKNQASESDEWQFGRGKLPIQAAFRRAGDIRPLLHAHRTLHEYFYIIRGELTVAVEDRRVRLRADDFLIVEPGERHTASEPSDDLLLLIIMERGREGDKVVY